mmetsp:Transcript_43928/g.105980  ORF Transcript_43928/g.105980 Transcript_43928/m.105980 type:complete len:468 (+) Transcript_43928:226-1629(+)
MEQRGSFEMGRAIDACILNWISICHGNCGSYTGSIFGDYAWDGVSTLHASEKWFQCDTDSFIFSLPSCWIDEWPKGCSNEPGHTGQKCYSSILVWLFGGWLVVFTFSSIFVCQIMIWRFVRRRTRASMVSAALSGNDCGPIRPISTGDLGAQQPKETNIMRTKQLQRLRLVSSQAFLFVASFFACSIWMFLLGIGEIRAVTVQEEMKIMLDMYPILVLSSVVTPLQGFFNMLVFLRPRYVRTRHDHPSETRLWAATYAIFGSPSKAGDRQVPKPHGEQSNPGDGVPPNKRMLEDSDDREVSHQRDESRTSSSRPRAKDSNADENSNFTHPKSLYQFRISSLSSSSSGSVQARNDNRWSGSSNRQSHSWIPLKAVRRHISHLSSTNNGSIIEPISEISDARTSSAVEENTIEIDQNETAGRRWESDNAELAPVVPSQPAELLLVPQRRISDTEIVSEHQRDSEVMLDA